MNIQAKNSEMSPSPEDFQSLPMEGVKPSPINAEDQSVDVQRLHQVVRNNLQGIGQSLDDQGWTTSVQ